jgi:hypothetical protein
VIFVAEPVTVVSVLWAVGFVAVYLLGVWLIRHACKEEGPGQGVDESARIGVPAPGPAPLRTDQSPDDRSRP